MVQRLLSSEVADVEPYLSHEFVVLHSEVVPIRVSSGIAVHPHEEVEFGYIALYCHIQVAALEVRVKFQEGLLDFRSQGQPIPCGKQLIQPLLRRVGHVVAAILVQNVGVVSAGS